MAGPIHLNPPANTPYLLQPLVFIPPTPQPTPLVSPRSYHSEKRELLLYALHEEGVIDDEYAYLNQEEANQIQSGPLPPETIPAFESILQSDLERHFYCRKKSYTIRTKCWERMEWISRYAAAIKCPIQWVLRGSELFHQLGEVFFKDKLTQQHPQHASNIQEIDLRNLKVPPGDVDLQAHCITGNEAYEIGEAQFLYDVFLHFQSLRFELRYPQSIQMIEGAENLCFALLDMKDAELPSCIVVCNKTIPWMHKAEWPGQRVVNLAAAVQRMRKDVEKYRRTSSLKTLKNIFHNLTPYLFNKNGLMEFIEELKGSLEVTPVDSHDLNIKDKAGHWIHHCHRAVLTRADGKQFDFTYFNSYTKEDENQTTAAQNIYLKLPSPLDPRKATLCWTKQAIPDQSFRIFRMPNKNQQEKWPFYCNALTQGELCSQKDLRQLLSRDFNQQLKPEDPIASAIKMLKNRVEKIGNKYRAYAPVFSFLFHATRDLDREVCHAVLDNFIPGVATPLDPRAFILDSHSPTSSSPQAILEAVLILFALRYLIASPAAQQQANFSAKVTTQHGVSCLAFYFFGYPLIVPFEPVKALQVLKPYTQTKEQVDHLIAISNYLRLVDYRETQPKPVVLPPFNHDDWFKQLREYISTPHLAELGFILLHNSTVFADPSRVYQEAIEQADKLIALPNRRGEVCDWLIQSASLSQLEGDMRKTWIETLQTAKTPPPDWNLHSFYLALRRKASLSTAPENVKEVVTIPIPATQIPEPVTCTENSTPSKPEVQPTVQLNPFPVTFAEALKHNLPPPALAIPKATRRREPKAVRTIPPQPFAPVSAPTAPIPIRPEERITKKGSKPLREAVVQKNEPPVALTEEQQLEELIGEFSKPNGLRSYKAIERLTALPTVSIPNLDPIYTYFKDLVTSPQELKFARNLFIVLLDRGALKSCKEFFSKVMVKHFPLQFETAERTFWIQIVRTLIEQKDWEWVYDLFAELDQHCVEERGDLRAVFKEIPLAGLKANPIRYADMMARLEIRSGRTFQDNVDQILRKPTPERLRKLLQFLVQAGTTDVVIWVLFFQAVITLKNKDFLIESYQAGLRLLERIDSTEDPFTWTHLQIFVNTLLFKIYLAEPSYNNFLKIRNAWDHLLGPAEHAQERCYGFVINLLSTLHTCENIDPPLLSCLESWIPQLTPQEALKRDQLNYYYGSLLTRQNGITSESKRVGLEQLVEAIPNLADVPVSMVEYALNCFGDDTMISKHFMDQMAPLLLKLAQHLLIEVRRDPKFINPTSFLSLLASYRKQLPPTSDLVQKFLRCACDLAHHALDHPVEGITFAPEIMGVLNLLKALNEMPEWLDEAFSILEKTRSRFNISRDSAAIQIRIKFARKKILEVFQSEEFAQRASGIVQTFAGLDGIYLEANTSLPPKVPQSNLTFRKLYHETCILDDDQNPSSFKLLVEVSILSALELLSNIDGRGPDIEIPAERYYALKQSISTLIKQNDAQTRLSTPLISELKSVEFLKHLLSIKPTNRDVAWILEGVCGHLLRKLFEEDPSSREHVAGLVCLYLFHPSFHLPSLESFGLCQVRSFLNQYTLLYQLKHSIKNTLPLHELCLTLNHSLPLSPLPERLTVGVYEHILKKLIPLGTFLTLQQSVNLICRYPLLSSSKTETDQSQTAEQQRAEAQRRWVGLVLKQLVRTPPPNQSEVDPSSAFYLSRQEKRIIFEKLIDLLISNPSLNRDPIFYATIFALCVRFLKRGDKDSAYLFEKLVTLHLSSCCAREREIQDPILFASQRSQLVGFFMFYAKEKLTLSNHPQTEELLIELKVCLDLLKLMEPYLPEDYKKSLPWDMIDSFNLLFFRNCFDGNTPSNGVQIIYQRP